jgi:hypothetical protein
MNKPIRALVVVAAAMAFAAGTAANAYSEKIKTACSADYASLCSQYKQGSSQLRRCFESNRKVLSNSCVSTLVNAVKFPLNT